MIGGDRSKKSKKVEQEVNIKQQVEIIKIQNSKGQTSADPITKEDLENFNLFKEVEDLKFVRMKNKSKQKSKSTCLQQSISRLVGGDSIHNKFSVNKFQVAQAQRYLRHSEMTMQDT